jgi:SprT protein
MNDYTTTNEIRDLVSETFARLGCPELDRVTRVEWNGRFTRRMGDARYMANHIRGTHRVRFSTPLWPRASVEERRETVIHEACHIAAAHIYGPGVQAHGREWKALMRKAGAKGDRCHRVDRTGLQRRTVRVPAYCGCMTHQITKARRTKMRKGIAYRCRRCRQELRLTPRPEGAPVFEALY